MNMQKKTYATPLVAVSHIQAPDLLSNTIENSSVTVDPVKADVINGEDALSKGNGNGQSSDDAWGDDLWDDGM